MECLFSYGFERADQPFSESINVSFPEDVLDGPEVKQRTREL